MDDFRKAFAEIGQLCSLIPSHVNIIALTATATHHTFHVVSERLSMKDPVVVGLSPYNDNIFYTVKDKIDVDILSEMLCDELKKTRTNFPKTIVYVRTYTDCCNLYISLKREMKAELTEPPGCPNVAGHRLIDIFNSAVTDAKQEEVLLAFTTKQTKLI